MHVRHPLAPPVEYRPASHRLQFALAFRSLYSPGAQARQMGESGVENNPGGHTPHELARAAANVPGEHRLHTLASVTAKLPTPHSLQFVVPFTPVYVPLAHDRQSLGSFAPWTGLYLPYPQSRQFSELGEPSMVPYFPARQ